MKRVRRKFSEDFKREAVRLMGEASQTNDELAAKLDVNVTLLYKWRKELVTHGIDAFPGKGQPKVAEDELARLKRENEQLRQERDFLKRAAVYFAKT